MPGNPYPTFARSERAEPHLERRRAILREHPEVRELFGYDRATIAVTVGVVAVQLTLAYGVAKSGYGAWGALVLALAVGAILSHWCAMAIHETSHNLAARTPLGNRAVAWLANSAMVLPIAETFRRYHLTHHVLLGVEDWDSDLPRALELRAIGTSPVRKALWLLTYFAVYLVRGATYAGRVSRAELLNMAVILAFDALLWRELGGVAMLYLALSTIIGHSFHPVAAHFIHEHYVFEPGQETNSYYGPLNWVTLNVGYHYEHHDVMNIPGSRLPQYRAITAKHYDSLTSHRSWTAVLWRFVASRKLGPQSRITRTRETHDRTRRLQHGTHPDQLRFPIAPSHAAEHPVV